jgi:hypothetical protein
VEVRVKEAVVCQPMEKVESHVLTKHQKNEGAQQMPRSGQIRYREGVSSLEVAQV